MALNMLHSSRGSLKFPVIFWQFSSLKSEDLLRLPNSLPVTDPERRRNTGSPFAASSLKAAAEKCPAAPHENSFALKFTTLVTFRTERALQTPVLRSPQPRGAVHLPSPAPRRAWPALPWLAGGRLPLERPEAGSGIPILAPEAACPSGARCCGRGMAARPRSAEPRRTAITS